MELYFRFQEKSTLHNNFIRKRGVDVFSRVGLFSGDYGITKHPPIYAAVRAVMLSKMHRRSSTVQGEGLTKLMKKAPFAVIA